MNKKIRNISAFIVAWIFVCIATGCNTKENQFSDRTIYNLIGEVSSCKTTSFPCKVKNGEVIKETNGEASVLRFSKEGLLTLFQTVYDGDTPLEYDENGVFIPNQRVDSLIRNEKGQLVRIVCKEDEEGNSDLFVFQYNENGTLHSQNIFNNFSCWENNYVYNAEGQIIEELCADGYDGLRRENKFTYEYKKMDKHGNWTIRMSRNVTDGQNFYEEREIEYYE